MKKIVGVILLITVFWACNKSKNTETKAPESTAALEKLELSANQAWDSLTKYDDNTINTMKALTKAVSLIPTSNANGVKFLESKIESLQKTRYTKETLTLKSMETYDSLTTAVINSLDSLVAKTPSIEKYGNIAQIQVEIREADQNLMRVRVYYDETAEKYNKLLTKASKEKSLKPFTLFKSL